MGDISRYKGGACKKMATGGAVSAAPVRRGSGRSRLQTSQVNANARQAGRDAKDGSGAVKQRRMAVGGQVQTPDVHPPMMPGMRPRAPIGGGMPPGMAGIAAMPMPAAQPPSVALPGQRMKRGGKVKGGC